MKNYKGGYILISLGLIALSTSFSGSIDYDKISATKKRIVLTDINVGGTKMPDVTVQPIYGNGKITFLNIYGFDIVVNSNNSVEVSEHQAPEDKGTRLFRHSVKIQYEGQYSYNTIELISDKETPITESENRDNRYGLMVPADCKVVLFSKLLNYPNSTNCFVNIFSPYSNTINLLILDTTNMESLTKKVLLDSTNLPTSITDTVTEL